jgi:hypothetical protein
MLAGLPAIPFSLAVAAGAEALPTVFNPGVIA